MSAFSTVRKYIYIHTSTHTYTYVHTHTYIHTYMHTYIHTYIHTYTHVCTYIHTHTPSYSNLTNLEVIHSYSSLQVYYGTKIQVFWNITPFRLVNSCTVDCMVLKVKTLGSSEMWVTIYQSTQCNIRQDMNLQPSVILNFLLFLQYLQTRKVPSVCLTEICTKINLQIFCYTYCTNPFACKFHQS